MSKEVKSAGILVFRKEPNLSFLLMKHSDRWDLPKGHLDGNETEKEAALRELDEETGITSSAIALNTNFRFCSEYPVTYTDRPGQIFQKTLVLFAAMLLEKVEIRLTEHLGCQWFDWDPPHSIQVRAIDPLLAYADEYFTRNGWDCF
ncbi:MAG: NUDIX domain-containing protein [Pirellulaceae bacterium]|nr:NUDIX domain-containing protein [Pirellulaceae bacterium]